jgi:hypothetical protein
MHDVVTPGFKDISSKGRIVNNDMDRTITISTETVANYRAYTGIWNKLTCGGVPTFIRNSGHHTEGTTNASSQCKKYGATSIWWAAKPTIDVDSLINQAVTSAYANIDMSEILALAAAAEGKKTIVSIAQILERVIRIARAVANYDKKTLKREISPRELKQRYMEARYALRPLFYDVLGATVAWRTNVQHARFRQTFRGFAHADEVTEAVTSTSTGSSPTVYTRDLFAKTTRKVSVRAGVLTDIKNLDNLTIWGINNLGKTAWELVPLSFVLDWFYNVGELFASFQPNMGIQTLASWYVVDDYTYYESEVVGSRLTRPADTSTTIYERDFVVTNARCTKTEHSIYRVANPQRPTLPEFRLKLDVLKLIDLLIIFKPFRKLKFGL